MVESASLESKKLVVGGGGGLLLLLFGWLGFTIQVFSDLWFWR